MRFASDILYRLLRATGTADAFPFAHDLEIPPLLLPVILAVAPFGQATAPATQVNRASFSYDVQAIFGPNTATAASTVGTFGRGAWLLIPTINFDTDFTDGVGSSRGSLFLIDAAGAGAIVWVAGRAIANVRNPPVTLYIPVTIPEDGFALQFFHSSTGAAQNSNFRVSGVALKLT